MENIRIWFSATPLADTEAEIHALKAGILHTAVVTVFEAVIRSDGFDTRTKRSYGRSWR